MSSAILPGSDSGIGHATAVALAGRGFDVGVTYNRDEQGAKETADVMSSDRAAAVKMARSGYQDVRTGGLGPYAARVVLLPTVEAFIPRPACFESEHRA